MHKQLKLLATTALLIGMVQAAQAWRGNYQNLEIYCNTTAAAVTHRLNTPQEKCVSVRVPVVIFIGDPIDNWPTGTCLLQIQADGQAIRDPLKLLLRAPAGTPWVNLAPRRWKRTINALHATVRNACQP